MLLFLVSLPMAQLFNDFNDPATVSQIVIILAIFTGILTAAIVVAVGSAG